MKKFSLAAAVFALAGIVSSVVPAQAYPPHHHAVVVHHRIIRHRMAHRAAVIHHRMVHHMEKMMHH